MLGKAAKVTLGKENTVIVGDGSSQDAVEARVRQIKNVIANTEQDYEREKLNERVARYCLTLRQHQSHILKITSCRSRLAVNQT